MPGSLPQRATTWRPDVAADALAGLLQPHKSLPPKLFYDDEGCRLFGEITRLPEYYPTRTERALLAAIAPELVASVPGRGALVEYGASDEAKAALLLDAARPGGGLPFAAYVPIDIAGGALAVLTARMRQSHPAIAVHPIEADFLRPLRLPNGIAWLPRLGFFPGSTIGNFDPPTARQFLAQARDALGRGACFLVGVDLRKDPAILVPAYDDAQGVTAAFNRNLLVRLNREARADFEVDSFAHRAVWNEAEGRIEMHLVSQRVQTVRLAGHTVHFGAGESIHTENSYKYGLEGFAALAGSAGWTARRSWTDAERLFSLHLLEN